MMISRRKRKSRIVKSLKWVTKIREIYCNMLFIIIIIQLDIFLLLDQAIYSELKVCPLAKYINTFIKCYFSFITSTCVMICIIIISVYFLFKEDGSVGHLLALSFRHLLHFHCGRRPLICCFLPSVRWRHLKNVTPA